MIKKIRNTLIFTAVLAVLGGTFTPANAGAFKNTQANWDKKAEEFKAAKAAQ